MVDAPPRPPGTPAEAAPTEGATAWLLRSMSAEHAEQVGPGANVEAVLVFGAVSASEVDVVPDDAKLWEGPPVTIDFEASLEGAATAKGTELSRRR